MADVSNNTFAEDVQQMTRRNDRPFRESGATVVEYALVAMPVAILCVVSATYLGSAMGETFNTARVPVVQQVPAFAAGTR